MTVIAPNFHICSPRYLLNNLKSNDQRIKDTMDKWNIEMMSVRKVKLENRFYQRLDKLIDGQCHIDAAFTRVDVHLFRQMYHKYRYLFECYLSFDKTFGPIVKVPDVP